MFSRTVSDENTSRRWKVRPIPSRARLWVPTLVMSLPSSVT